MKKFFVMLMVVFAVLASGCTRVETGHVGIRVNFNGTYDTQELQPGFHQTVIGSVKEVVSNEMTIEVPNLTPQTKDKTVMHDMDLAFTYTVQPSSIVELMTNYKGRDLVAQDGSIYPVGQYVANIVTTSTADVISKYDALEANDNREKIRAEILNQTRTLLTQEKLDGIVHVKQLFVKNMQIDPKLTNSALAAIAAENELKAKKVQVQVAVAEAERAKALSNVQNLEYMKVQAQLNISEAIKEGKVNTIIIPSNLTMLGHVGK